MRLLLALALLVIPLVGADHVYSHRYVVEGRLIGSDGLPLPGREVLLEADAAEFLQPCRDAHRPVTDQFGDFEFCYHRHELGADPPAFNVTYGNASVSRSVDVAFRRTALLLHEPNETGVAPEGWNTTYRVTGRVFRPGPTTLEGVFVFGEAVIGLPVNLTVRTVDGTATVFRSQTDGFGDFDLVVETEAHPSTLSLTLEAMGNGQPTQLNATSHRTEALIYTAAVQPADAPSGPTPAGDRQPGSTTPRLNPVLLVAVGLGLVAAIVLSRRKA